MKYIITFATCLFLMCSCDNHDFELSEKEQSYEFVDKSDDGTVFKKPRCCFEGEQCLDSIYLNKDVTDYPFGSGGSVRYIF